MCFASVTFFIVVPLHLAIACVHFVPRVKLAGQSKYIKVTALKYYVFAERHCFVFILR